MARTVSFIVLISLVVLMGLVFFAVMQQFLLPLFLAVLLVVMFRPLHAWFLRKLPKRPRLAAGLTTLTIVTIVLAPLLGIFFQAGIEAVTVAKSTDLEQVMKDFQVRGGHLLADARETSAKIGVTIPPDNELISTTANTVRDWIAPAALRTGQFVFGLLFGGIIMLVALYFFLADGAQMVDTIVDLTPMDPAHVSQMLTQFDRISRAVVLATLLSAVGQAVLGFIAYVIVGMPHLFLLTAATGLLALVPFVGATAVWVPCAAWLYFLQNRPGAAIFLVVWGLLVISTADNFIKPYILKGQSNLHPLLALLSVIGGVQALGPIGIFVGPMVVALLHSLLQLLRTELAAMEQKTVTPIA